jgi:hypothetical protein
MAVKIMRKTMSIWLALAILGLLAWAQDPESKRGPSTPEERKRFLAIVAKFEKSPLDPGMITEVDWARQWLEDIPDVNVTVCPTPLGHFLTEKYQYKSRVGVQFTLAMGAFLIEHPEKASDTVSQYLAGIQSALRMYKAILASKPEAKSRALDDLLDRQAEGTLNDFVRQAGKLCEDTRAT